MKSAIITENPLEYSISSKITNILSKMLDGDVIYIGNKKKSLRLNVENQDLRSYDVVISLGDKYSYGILTKPTSVHIHYSLNINPIWEQDKFMIQGSKLRKVVYYQKLSYRRIWDRMAAERVNLFISSSSITRKKIKKYYRKDSRIIYPPVDVIRFNNLKPIGSASKYFVYVGSLYPYKKIEEVIQAFNKLGYKLKIVGSGDKKYISFLKSISKVNIEILNNVTDDELSKLYISSYGLIYTVDDNFASSVIEVQAAGKPALVYMNSSAADLIVNNFTGMIYDKIESGSLYKAIKAFKNYNFDPGVCIDNSKIYSSARFQNDFKSLIKEIS